MPYIHIELYHQQYCLYLHNIRVTTAVVSVCTFYILSMQQYVCVNTMYHANCYSTILPGCLPAVEGPSPEEVKQG